MIKEIKNMGEKDKEQQCQFQGKWNRKTLKKKGFKKNHTQKRPKTHDNKCETRKKIEIKYVNWWINRIL